MVGYGLYWWAPTWPFVFAGLVFVMAWSSMASPTLFAVVGDALPQERRALGFTVQSILRRIPIAVAPTLGGLAIAAYGVLRAGFVSASPSPWGWPRSRSWWSGGSISR